MGNRRWALAVVLLLASPTGRLFAQEASAWIDPSPHTVQFVTVEDNVKLEVLDWGGTGTPLVLLAGLGNTAHVFDEFAPKLTSEYHVYGITRRGYGASSVAASGYSADRLGDDVLAVLDALKLNRPVLVGHSIAGEELSSVGSRQPQRIAGLIYLDAGNQYAYYDRSRGYFPIDLQELQRKLEQLKAPLDQAARQQLLQDLLQETMPGFERDLREEQIRMQAMPSQPASRPVPSADDLASFPAYRSWYTHAYGITYPEAEIRLNHESTPGGGVGKFHSTPGDSAIIEGLQKYTDIRVPVLAIYAIPHDYRAFFSDPAAAAATEASDAVGNDAQAKAFQSGVPSARVVRLPHANHYVFLSNEADVLREMRVFLSGLH